MAIMKEFMEFLREYKVVPLAIAFIMGIASTALIQSLVNNIIMPLINPLVPSGGWQNASIQFGPVPHQVIMPYGSFLGAAINFVIIAFVVFIIAKIILKEEKVAKK